MTFPICSYTFTVFAFKILEISVTKYSRILKEYLFRADVMLFFFFFLHREKQEHEEQNFFFFFLQIVDTYTHTSIDD